ncbi:hypothetical protein BdWA1_000255 [Babesia duncani]|uniref:Uncharacterized protein n=1 Tax=Babesia duncani TaxID=323732 RepID=A0AAD9PMG4_9APIC|nr:hypothetical protein BdWA1_000255 [Babesia duncani]
MENLSKTAVFKVLKSMLKRRNVNGFERIQTSFDQSIHNSLNFVLSSSNRNFSLPLKDRLGDVVNNATTIGITNNEKLVSNISIDRLQSFDLVVAFQFLALHAKHLKQKNQGICAFQNRFHALLILARKSIDDFTFIRLSLLLNSLCNILHAGAIDIEYCKFIGTQQLVQISEDIGTSFSNFNKTVDEFIILNTWMYFHNISNIQIDIHSICMILKYYAALKRNNCHVFNLITHYLLSQSSISVIDKVNIIYSLSLCLNNVAYDTENKDSIVNRIRNSHMLSQLSWETQNMVHESLNKVNESKVEENLGLVQNCNMIMKHLNEIEAIGEIQSSDVQAYMNALANFTLGTINNIEFLMPHAQVAMTMASKLTKGSNITLVDYGNLLDRIYMLWIECKLIDLEDVCKLIFTRNNLSMCYSILTGIENTKSPMSLKPFAQITTLMNQLKQYKTDLDLKQQQYLDSIILSLSSIISKQMYKLNSNGVTILHVVNLETLVDTTQFRLGLERLLLNIYANLKKTVPEKLQMMKHTSILLKCSADKNWHWPKSLEDIITKTIMDDYKQVANVNPRIILRLMHHISILYRKRRIWTKQLPINEIMDYCISKCSHGDDVFILDVLLNFIEVPDTGIEQVVNIQRLNSLTSRLLNELAKRGIVIDDNQVQDSSNDAPKLAHLLALQKQCSIVE